MRLLFVGTKVLFLIFGSLSFANTLTSSKVLSEVFSNNPELGATQARVDAENAAISSKYSLDNPKFGYMKESNLTAEQRDMGPMTSWTISQEIMFPTKYFTMGSMQSSKVQALKEEFLDKKLELRQKALTQYYNFYSALRIASLLKAQRETLREIARIAETRRATGAVPQQDEMKAHVEQTMIENEILLQNQEVVEGESSLKALINWSPETVLELPAEELKIPKITTSLNQIENLALSNSKMISAQKFWMSEADSTKTYAKMSYLPDFMLNYRKPFGTNAPENAYTFDIEMTIPLWFFSKQNSEVSIASAKKTEAEKRMEQTKRQVESESKSLSVKAETLSQVLKIYETALIPQSTSALNSSRSAYSAGKVGFQELLDSERSLFNVKIDYYKNLAKFVEALSSLEKMIGTRVSDLPFEGNMAEPSDQPSHQSAGLSRRTGEVK
jgi:outer membrane protein TolC